MKQKTEKNKIGRPLKWSMNNPSTGERWHQGETITRKGQKYKFVQYSYVNGNLNRPVFSKIEKWNKVITQRRTYSRNANRVIRSNYAVSDEGKFRSEVKKVSVLLGISWRKHFSQYNNATVKLNCSLSDARTKLFADAMIRYSLTQEQVIQRISIKDQTIKLTLDHIIPLCCASLFFDSANPWIAHFILNKLSDISNLQVLTLKDNKRKGHSIVIDNKIVEVKPENKDIIKAFLIEKGIHPNA